MTGTRGPISGRARTNEKNVRRFTVAQGDRPMCGPPPRDTWSPETKTAWATYWRSPLGAAAAPVDLPQLLALYDLIDTRARLLAELAETASIMVTGSKGQPAVHPSLRALNIIGGQVNALADRFGIGPASRTRLGVDLAGMAAAEDAEEARWAAILSGEGDG